MSDLDTDATAESKVQLLALWSFLGSTASQDGLAQHYYAAW